MKIYDTVEVKYWNKSDVYVYFYTTEKEEIIHSIHTTQVIKELNLQGYSVSATYVKNSNPVYIMTKEIIV